MASCPLFVENGASQGGILVTFFDAKKILKVQW